MAKAHQLDTKLRTQDVGQSEAASFADLLLSEPVLRGLSDAGYRTPSPIQLKAIPLGRCGLDLVVQSKAGTGKTCVFAVLALETVNQVAAAELTAVDSGGSSKVGGPRVLALSPTREVALQSSRAIETLGRHLGALRCGLFIGGISLQEDRAAVGCHVAVGTPGRVRQLMEAGHLRTERVRMLVLDEADLLLNDSFQQDINWIYSSLPHSKQVLALSATYPDYMADQLTLYMRDPTLVRLSGGQLLGLRLYWHSVPHSHLPNVLLERKAQALSSLLSRVQFSQCLVFSNYQERAQDLCQRLTADGWPVAYLAGRLQQSERIGAYDKLRDFQCRVLVSTDVAARGVDAENVDLVVNLDLPRDHRTLQHRIGRAGRFGSYGAAVTLVGDGPELSQLREVERLAGLRMAPLPEPPPRDLTKSAAGSDASGVPPAFVEIEDSDDIQISEAAPSQLFESALTSWGRRSKPPAGQQKPQQQKKNKKARPSRRQQHREPDAAAGTNINRLDEPDDLAALEDTGHGSSAAAAGEDSEVLRLRALLLGGGGSSQPQPQLPLPPPSRQLTEPLVQPTMAPLATEGSSGDVAEADFRWIGEEAADLARLLGESLGCSTTLSTASNPPADMQEARDLLASNSRQGLLSPRSSLPPPPVRELPDKRLAALNERVNALASRCLPAPAGIESAAASIVLPAPIPPPTAAASIPFIATASAPRSLTPGERILLGELLAADAQMARQRRLVRRHQAGCDRELALIRRLRVQLQQLQT